MNYASECNSRADAEVLNCLSELEMSGIFSVTKDLWGQTVNAVDPVDDLFLPEDLPLEDMWKTVYNSCRSAWKQKLCNLPESSTVPEQAHNNPTVSNLDAVHAPLVMRLESQPRPPPVNIDEMITKWTLNVEQTRAFSLIVSHAQQNWVTEPLRMYLGGPGGTGKLQVIAALTDYFTQCRESRRLRLALFMGMATKNTNGTTLHTVLSLNQSQRNQKKGNGKTKMDLIAMWIGIDYLFIDEVSMIGCSLLLQIHEALVDAKGCTEPFGGVSVIFAGDFVQLPPVNQTKLFSQTKSAKETTIFSQLLWRLVTTVAILTEQMCQAGPENLPFIEMLSRLHDGRCTQADYELLNTHMLRNVLEKEKMLNTHWHDAPMIVYSNAIKDAINLQATLVFARHTGQHVQWYHAVDTY